VGAALAHAAAVGSPGVGDVEHVASAKGGASRLKATSDREECAGIDLLARPLAGHSDQAYVLERRGGYQLRRKCSDHEVEVRIREPGDAGHCHAVVASTRMSVNNHGDCLELQLVRQKQLLDGLRYKLRLSRRSNRACQNRRILSRSSAANRAANRQRHRQRSRRKPAHPDD
jgi:hypothetical protein